MMDGEARREPSVPKMDAAGATDVRRIVDSGALLLWVGSPDGTRRWVGHAMSMFTGRAQHELAGQRWTESIHPEDRDRRTAIDRVCLAADRSYSLDYRLRRHDGRYLWMMDSATPHRDESGHLEGHVGVCIDIHERRLVEDEIAERLRKFRLAARR